MRSEQEIMALVMGIAETDPRIRAVLLSGSRNNPKVKPDLLQDYDVVYLVSELESFKEAPHWIDIFGERMIMQIPQSMTLPDDDSPGGQTYTYLMHFQDGNRLDLCLCLTGERERVEDSLSQVLLDKDDIYPFSLMPDESDYLPISPDQKLFSDCCNEFWWVSTYVIKGLLRKQATYAKAMLEKPVRDMLMMMLKWHVGTKTNFSANMGMAGKYLKEYLDESRWEQLLTTYPDAQLPNIWLSLGNMMVLFRELSLEVASQLDLIYNWEEDRNVSEYYDKKRKEQENKS